MSNSITQFTKPYNYGFHTSIETDQIKSGLTSKLIKQLSKKKNEPSFLLDFRLKAFLKWKNMKEPNWSFLDLEKTDYNKIIYYSAPKKKKKLNNLDEVDPKILETFEKLGIPLEEQKRLSNVAVDAVFDSVSILTTFQKDLSKAGVIFCPISKAVKYYPKLVKKYLGTVVPNGDNFFAALNSAVFSEGSFCFIPKNVICPLELSTYFRINDKQSGQFERTLIIAEKNSKVVYLEGCTAPQYDEKQLHAAIVELISFENAEIKYSTVQNWYSGDEFGKGGIYNLVTKRGLCLGKNSKISWTQVETGSAITWKYPSCVLIGDKSSGEFYSIALTKDYQQADTGTKMIHVGKSTSSKIISKGISLDKSKNTYRGLVKVNSGAHNAKNYTQCDSLLLGKESFANTYPYIEINNSTSQIEHEASTSQINEEQLFYLMQRGIEKEYGISLLLNGFCQEIFNKLPLEFAAEADKLLQLKLENTIG